MNEATFEGNLNGTLDRLFQGPLRARIEHQTQLSLKFGHHQVLVDGEAKSSARGRLDVLLRAGEVPLAVLELKNPGLKLTADDEDQAWSYARLLDPMPPLYVVTNGEDTRILRTYDRTPLDVEAIDEDLLSEQIAAAAGAAAASQKTAIDYLLGRSPEAFRALFQAVSEDELALLFGSVGDLTRPLADGFLFPRKAVAILHRRLVSGEPVLVLQGRPLSGRTSVAADLCRISFHGPEPLRLVPLYINCAQRPQGVFRTLASGLSRQTRVPATADDVRGWLTMGRMAGEDCRPVIILDSWPSPNPGLWEGEVAELLDLVSDSTFSLVVVLDDAQAEALLKDPARGQATRLGSLAGVIRLRSLLDHEEFAVTAHMLAEHNGLFFEKGAEHNTFYRYPHTWRMLATSPASGMIPAVLGIEHLDAANQIVNLAPKLAEHLRRYTLAVVEEDLTGPLRPMLLGSPGWVTWEKAEQLIGENSLGLLQSAGLVRARSGPRGRIFATMQIPPLLASAAASLLSERFATSLGKRSTAEAVSTLLEECRRFPYASLVGAMAITLTDQRLNVVDELLAREPEITLASPRHQIGLLLEGQSPLILPPDLQRQVFEEGSGHYLGDTLPYLVASHLALWPDFSTAEGREIWLRIIHYVAAAGVPLFQVEFGQEDQLPVALPILSYELIGGRSLVAKEAGVIEPITDAIRRAALDAPDLISSHVDQMTKTPDVPLPLLYRTWVAVSSVSQLNTPVAAEAQRWSESLEPLVFARLDQEIRPEPDGLGDG